MLVRRRSPEKRKHLAGLLRVFAYVTVLGAVCAALGIRAARAELTDQSLVIGRQMMALAGPGTNDVTHVTINGQPIFVGSALGKEPVSAVLDRYAAHCQENAAQAPESWRELSNSPGATGAAKASSLGGGLLRGGNDQEGTVLCFVRSEDSKPTVAEAFASFADTGELGALGHLRYVYAKKTEQGNTHVLTAWTMSRFNLRDMMPADDGRDVPGADFAGLPRPEGAQRILSTRLEGTPFGVNVYRSRVAPEKVAAAFDDALTKQGWFALDTEMTSADGLVGHLYEKDGVVLTLSAHVEEGYTFTALGLAGVQSMQ